MRAHAEKSKPFFAAAAMILAFSTDDTLIRTSESRLSASAFLGLPMMQTNVPTKIRFCNNIYS